MSSNIKFRAWIKSAEVFVDVHVIDFNERYIVHEDLGCDNIQSLEPHEPECVTSLDDCILYQYTGLKDQKGREIYMELKSSATSTKTPNYWRPKEIYMFVRLEMVNDVSNKFYEVSVTRDSSNRWLALAKYGRISGPGYQTNTLYLGPDQDKAIGCARGQVSKKIAKGYEVTLERGN